MERDDFNFGAEIIDPSIDDAEIDLKVDPEVPPEILRESLWIGRMTCIALLLLHAGTTTKGIDACVDLIYPFPAMVRPRAEEFV